MKWAMRTALTALLITLILLLDTSDGQDSADEGGDTSGVALEVVGAENNSSVREESRTPEQDHLAKGIEQAEAASVQQNETSKAPSKKIECLLSYESNGVVLINASVLMQVLTDQYNVNVTNRTLPAPCTLVFFYAPWCPFSTSAAPHFNALGRIMDNFPTFAIDASRNSGLNTQFGILSLPSILLFHNSKYVAKFNHTKFTVANMVKFLASTTSLDLVSEDDTIWEPSSLDLEGPVPTVVVQETDYNLYLAWCFTIIWALFYFSKSSLCHRVIECVRSNWREVEIQHEHMD